MESCVEIVKSLIDDMDCDIICNDGIEIERFVDTMKLNGYDIRIISYSFSMDKWIALFKIGNNKFTIECGFKDKKPKIQL